jgi:signal transduction histidine kinase
MTLPGISSLDGSPQVLALIDDLADCTDTKQVLTAATTRFNQLFGDYALYGILLSDQGMEHWRLLPLRNSEGSVEGGVSVEELPPHTDIDAIAERLGSDVTALVRASPQLWAQLRKDQTVFYANCEDATRPLMEELRAMLPIEAATVMAASWTRPAVVGGRGCGLLCYTQSFNAKDLLKLYALAVKATTRLAFFPDYMQLVARLETISHSLRRNIVHDLKTPVTVIKGFAKTLLIPSVSNNPHKREEMLTGIVEQANRLVDDLNDILAPLNHKWEPQLEEFDLARLLKKVVMAEQHTERAQSHTLEVVGAEQSLMVTADRRKVRRVFENLLSNAVKYSPGEGKRVRVELTVENGQALVLFIDEGIGMTEKQLARVMHGTGRAVNASLGIEGSGFGLDSCRRVLEAHGGALYASSRLGEGSTFTAALPIAPQELKA